MPKSRLLLATLTVALCSSMVFAQEQKPRDKDEKHAFRLETDSGRYGVASDRFDPKRLGVGIYPGAKVDERENQGKGANLSLEWGRDSVHLYVQKYVTNDPADKVLAFYRKELAKFGPVLECRDGKPMAAVNSELKCEDDKDEHHEKHHEGIQLKSGTERKQHIVGVTPRKGGTDFDVAYVEQSKRGEI
jgi:hypothetical protein